MKLLVVGGNQCICFLDTVQWCIWFSRFHSKCTYFIVVVNSGIVHCTLLILLRYYVKLLLSMFAFVKVKGMSAKWHKI